MKMKITYWGDQPPKIECESLSDIEIEMVDGEEANWLFLKHGGVSVYHTENSNDVLSDWWFSTVRGIHSDNEDAFDVQDLPEIPEDRLYIYEALYGEDEKQRMAYAIDIGLLDRDGVNLDLVCRKCGAVKPEAGDGRDGMCPSCAEAAK